MGNDNWLTKTFGGVGKVVQQALPFVAAAGATAATGNPMLGAAAYGLTSGLTNIGGGGGGQQGGYSAGMATLGGQGQYVDSKLKYRRQYGVRPFDLKGLDRPAATAGINDFLKQQGELPEIQKMVAKTNAADAALMDRIAPGLLATTRNYAASAEAASKGLIPADVQESVTRNAAFSALGSGIDPSSSAGRMLTSRDLGLTSLEMQKRGMEFMEAAMAGSAYLAPNRMSAGLLDAGTFLTRADQEASIDAEIARQNTQMDWAFENDFRLGDPKGYKKWKDGQKKAKQKAAAKPSKPAKPAAKPSKPAKPAAKPSKPATKPKGK
jgi:hypothetical protein